MVAGGGQPIDPIGGRLERGSEDVAGLGVWLEGGGRVLLGDREGEGCEGGAADVPALVEGVLGMGHLVDDTPVFHRLFSIKCSPSQAMDKNTKIVKSQIGVVPGAVGGQALEILEVLNLLPEVVPLPRTAAATSHAAAAGSRLFHSREHRLLPSLVEVFPV